MLLRLLVLLKLDRLPDFESRATSAINALVANKTSFGARSRNIEVADIRFYSRLPLSDISPIGAGVLASDPGNARFVAVTARPVAMTAILPANLFGGSSIVTTGASAVAGFTKWYAISHRFSSAIPSKRKRWAYEEATLGITTRDYRSCDPASPDPDASEQWRDGPIFPG